MAFADDAPVHLLKKKCAARKASTAGWRKIGRRKIYARSIWEANFARYLQWCQVPWAHEPRTFWFKGIRRGVCSYLPDFRATSLNGKIVYYEVKGYMDKKSATKLKRMKKYYPDIEIHVIDASWFRFNSHLSGVIPGWEKGR